LGLWVSAEILEKHRARVSIRSRQEQPGQGTVFSILFPVNSSLASEQLPAQTNHAAKKAS
jgi:signal transduction histidine kinase